MTDTTNSTSAPDSPSNSRNSPVGSVSSTSSSSISPILLSNHNSFSSASPEIMASRSSGDNSHSSSSADMEMGPLIASPSKVRNNNKNNTIPDRPWHSFWTIANQHGKVLSACGLYSFCSVSMVLTNKSLASSYNYLIQGDLNILLVVVQAIVAVICVETCKRFKWVEYPAFNMETARQWAPVNVFFCLMLFTGMASLQYNSVPMVTIFKNITNILTNFGDYYFFNATVDSLVLLAFGIMLLGAVAAAWNDLSITGIGIFWMALNCVSTSGYVLYMKFATKNVKLSKFGMVFYNNVLCTAFLLPVAFVMGQVQVFWETPAIHTPDYFLKNGFAGLVGFFLNFASLHCVATTGPTTYAIIGSLNKIPVAFLGYMIFDSVISNETWFFIGVSMCGGFLYSYAKIRQGNNSKNNLAGKQQSKALK